MSAGFDTPQSAEDALYDAIENRNLDALMSVWEFGEDILCLLPMRAAALGADAVRAQWGDLLGSVETIEITVTHLRWIETPEMAMHLVEESASFGNEGPPQPPIYAVNVFRRSADGWHLVAHQNAPAPPPLRMPQGA